MRRKRSKLVAAGVAMLACAAAQRMALAGAHTWDVNEVFTNADGTIIFIELREANGTPGEIGLNGKIISADGTGKSVTINHNVASPTSNKFFLLATQTFADLPNAPVPDQIIPPFTPPFFVVAGDTVRYSTLDAFVFGAVPTDGHLSQNRLTGVQTNSPTNYAGVSHEVDASGGGPTPGDFDGDGDVDLIDYNQFGDCESSPETAPAPANPGVTAQECLDTFDRNSDGDVDLEDFADFQANFGA